MWNLIQRNSSRRRRTRNFSLNAATACQIGRAENLESRALLTALLPQFTMGGKITILPEVNGLQLLAVQNPDGATTDLYTTDGTQAGTVAFASIPGRVMWDAGSNAPFTDYAIVGQDLYFNAWVSLSNTTQSVWKTNGLGAVKLMEQTIFSNLNTPPQSKFTEFGGLVYFAANTPSSGRELWKTDGTPAGTTMAVDVIPGSTGSDPRQLKVFDSKLFFTASTTETVYRTDGTSVGTTAIIDGDTKWSFFGLDAGTNPVAVTNSKLILKRETIAGGIDLLAMDTAMSVPTVIQHFSPEPNRTYIVNTFTVVGNQVFFLRGNTAADSQFSGELWKSNGTVAGTAAVSSNKLWNALERNDKFIGKYTSISFSPVVFPTVSTTHFTFYASGDREFAFWQTDGVTLTEVARTQIDVPRFLTHEGRVYFPERNGAGLFEISGALSAGRRIGGISRQYDGEPQQISVMLGDVWFVAWGRLWKVDPTLPDAVPGPTPTGVLASPEASLGTTQVNGQNVFRVSWNPVPNAIGYRINGVASGTATSVDIPYVNETDYSLRVQAIFANGQLSEESNFSFTGYLNSNNLTYGGTTPFTQNIILRRDIGTTWLYRAEFVDPINGKVLETSYFRWTTVNNKHEATLPFTISKVPIHGRVMIRVLPSTITSSKNASTLTVELPSPEISASFNGASTTITWPSVGGPTGYDIWIDDVTRGIRQYIRNQNLTTNSFTNTFPTGTYKVWVRSKDIVGGFWSQPTFITIGEAPRLLSPTGTLTTPDHFSKFQWPIVKGATGFELWVNQIGGTAKIIHETALPGNSTSFRPSNQLPHGRYTAWIRSQGTGPGHGVWSAPINFTILPYPVQPVVATGQFDPTPTITWTAPFAGIKYELWIGKASDGTGVFRQANITGTSFTLPTALANGNYKVSLRGVTADGLTLPWSNQDKVQFTIGLQGQVSASRTGSRTLTWNEISGATRYDIWVNYVSGSQPAQSQIYRNENATGTSIVLPSSLPAGNYRVWMRAIHVEAGITFMTDWTVNGTTFTLV